MFAAAFSADGLMMTPGLIEAWRDTTTGLYIHKPPVNRAMAAQPDRWELEILPYEQCLADVLTAIDVVRARNPGVRVLITTSPVPMSFTFSGQDIRIANTYSKSVLRAVCGAAPALRPQVDYFPSYESATLSAQAGVWEQDRLHVRGGFVGEIVAHMLDHYLEGGDDAALGLLKARTLMSEGDHPQAEAAARAVLGLRPDDVEAAAVLGEALIQLRRPAEAEAVLRPMVARHPDRAGLRTALGRAIALCEERRIPEAIAEIEAAALLPSMGLAEFRSVSELVHLHAPPEVALALSLLAIERFPLQEKAYALRLKVLIARGRNGEAITLLRRADELPGCPSDLRLQLAKLVAANGQAKEAWSIVRRVLAAEPRNARAAAMLQNLVSAESVNP